MMLRQFRGGLATFYLNKLQLEFLVSCMPVIERVVWVEIAA